MRPLLIGRVELNCKKMCVQSQRANEKIQILGIEVDNVSLSEALDKVDGFLQSDSPHQIVTANPEFVIAAEANAEFRETISQADLVVPDGAGLLWAAKRQDKAFKERVAGVDLVIEICELAAAKGYKVFLLGAAPGVAVQAAVKLIFRLPSLQIVGVESGSPNPAMEKHLATVIRSSGADILFVAFGAPNQDLWIKRNLPHLGVKVAMGVGGTFDYLSGKVSRAPDWLQRAGLEWLYRLARQPWRIKRQLALVKFVWQVMRRKS